MFSVFMCMCVFDMCNRKMFAFTVARCRALGLLWMTRSLRDVVSEKENINNKKHTKKKKQNKTNNKKEEDNEPDE